MCSPVRRMKWEKRKSFPREGEFINCKGGEEKEGGFAPHSHRGISYMVDAGENGLARGKGERGEKHGKFSFRWRQDPINARLVAHVYIARKKEKRGPHLLENAVPRCPGHRGHPQ